MKMWFTVIAVIGLLIMGFANIAGIGYGLYLWGAVGNPLSAAAWGGFVIWIKMIITGFVLFIGGYINSDDF